MKRLLIAVVAALLVLAPSGWSPQGWLGGRWPSRPDLPRGAPPYDARERHAAALERDPRVAVGTATRWLEAGERALASPLAPVLPYRERLVADGGADGGEALVLRVTLAPPEVLHLVTAHGEGARGGLIVDVLRRRDAFAGGVLAAAGDEPPLERLAAFGPAPLDVRWQAPLAGDYLVRVQSAFGASGAFGLALARRAPLDFPVATEAADPVRSLFGAPRDGGRREHHGIDIFAPRGTPVLAAADGLVVRVGESARGGLHIWQRALDEAGRAFGALYYAHLDSVEVLAGTRVARGERLGTVGNTGNARTTPPHLHFGWYRRFRGPADPLPLVGTRRPPRLAVGAGHALGRWLTVDAGALNLRAAPAADAPLVGRLERGELVRIDALAGEGAWARVRDGAGRVGFVARRHLATPRPRGERLASAVALRVAPETDAAVLGRLAAGEPIVVLGRYGAMRRVTSASGRSGWIEGTSPVE